MQHNKPRPPKRPTKPSPNEPVQIPDFLDEPDPVEAYRCNPSKKSKPGPLLKRLLRSVQLPSRLEDATWEYLRNLGVETVDDRGRTAIVRGWEDYALDCVLAGIEFAQELACAGTLPLVDRNPSQAPPAKEQTSEEEEDEREEDDEDDLYDQND